MKISGNFHEEHGKLLSSSLENTDIIIFTEAHSQRQDSRLKMRTFLKPASLGYGVNKQY